MATLLSLALLGVVFAVHTVVAAVLTRYLRLRMRTRWGTVLYVVALVPLALLVSTYLFGLLVPGAFDPITLVSVTVGMPAVLGATIDVLYMPAPEEYDLPDTH